MFPEHRHKSPQTGRERVIAFAFVAILVALFAAEVASDFRLEKLTAVSFLLAWIPLLFLHEFGHAIVAWALGWYVGRIVVGFGRPVRTFQIGETQFEIRSFPLEGFVQCVPRNLKFPRTKNALVYFAGPGVELLLAGLLLIAVGPETLLGMPTQISTTVLQGLWGAAMVGAVLNLIPHSVATENGRVPNDGLGILQSFFLPEHYFAERIGATYNPTTSDWEEHDSADWWKR